ncbi:hypothetical protein NDU88_003125 [Pleurodeles waltl]|uniref:CCHC-type domain-containing protein n=1 Tax=Pleurodeles waltl TaxID=8319 RepID=A0AAV7T4U4_PLEWA|nr:hypothetical protein NDU88_003125 [Pleurodeles waltl]
MKGESYIKASVGEETPPEGTPAYIVMEEKGVAPCLWLKQWHKLTEKHGSVAFPIHGTFNIRILENLRFAMYNMKVPPRPAQFEALAIWELMARQQQQKKFETRIRKVEKTLADARWDNAQKVWRSDILQGIKLFPAIATEEEATGKKATCKTNRRCSKDREDESEDEEFIIQLLNDRPPPYAASEQCPSTSSAPPAPVQNNETPNSEMQSGSKDPSLLFTPQIPQVRRIYPDVPILKTAENYQPQVPRYYSSDNSTGMILDPTVMGVQNGRNPTLAQAESTQLLMPQKQMQDGTAHAQMTGSQTGMLAMMTHSVGMNMPQNLGNGQNPDAISLPITVGPPVPLYIQPDSGMSGQGSMVQSGTERRCIENTPETTPIAALPTGSGSLMEFSPICAQSTVVRSSPPLMIPLSSNTEKLPQPSMAVDANATLMGLNAQKLTQWFNSLNSTQSSASGKGEDYLNRVRLNMEAEELVEGTMGLNRLESYSEEELRYLCPRITREVNKVHRRLQEIADKNGVEIDKTKHLSRSYRLDFGTTDFEHMRSAGMKTHLRELLQSAQVWRCLDKWESRWAKKKEKKKDSVPEHKEKRPQSSDAITMLPMRETAGGKLIHVPWHRSDIQSFTDDFPKLREKPIEWYQQTDRFVKLAKCLWEDLNTLFEIVVPADLWEDCKRAVGWPTSEPERDRDTGAPSPMVMSLYYKVIEHLKKKVAAKNVDWQKIDRTAQEAKESIHGYYERLLKAFKNYSGTETIEAKDMLHFVFRFVEGLRPEISQMIKTHLICWQSKPIDEVLNYAKYCSDEIEVKQKKLKEKVMMMQLKAAQTGLQGFQQQVPQPQPQGNMVFQPQARGREGFGSNGPDLNTVATPNGVQAMKRVMPCHVCGIVGHWKRECPMVVQEGAGVGQQNNDVNAFQPMRGPKMRGPNPNFQTINQLQGLQPMQPQQMQMPRMQMTQMQPMQQQFPMVPNQQMQIPLAPVSQQQVMVPPQVSSQVMNTNGTVQQFPLHSENGINNVWESESSGEEGDCVLAASLEVDQKGPCGGKSYGSSCFILS